ncbi:putative ribonuclease H-like domain-containing protein [Tanacetum coccineum]
MQWPQEDNQNAESEIIIDESSKANNAGEEPTKHPDFKQVDKENQYSEIPALEEIYDNPTDGIFTNSSYDDEGVVADFTNLEPIVNVSPIPTSRINSIHPSTLILRDPQSAVQTRSKVTKSSGAHAFALRAWYATLSTFLLKNGHRRGTIDKTLFIKKDKHDIILVQVYMDDIIFGLTKKSWCDEFEALMKNKFQMSSMGELTFFLGLQTASTPIETHKPLVKDEEASDVDVYLYRSMIGSLMYLTASRPDIMFVVCTVLVTYDGANLTENPQQEVVNFPPMAVDLFLENAKKQTIMATYNCRAEYLAAANFLWARFHMDFKNKCLTRGVYLMNTKIYIGMKVLYVHCKGILYFTPKKHLAIRNPFIKDAYEKNTYSSAENTTDDNL